MGLFSKKQKVIPLSEFGKKKKGVLGTLFPSQNEHKSYGGLSLKDQVKQNLPHVQKAPYMYGFRLKHAPQGSLKAIFAADRNITLESYNDRCQLYNYLRRPDNKEALLSEDPVVDYMEHRRLDSYRVSNNNLNGGAYTNPVFSTQYFSKMKDCFGESFLEYKDPNWLEKLEVSNPNMISHFIDCLIGKTRHGKWNELVFIHQTAQKALTHYEQAHPPNKKFDFHWVENDYEIFEVFSDSEVTERLKAFEDAVRYKTTIEYLKYRTRILEPKSVIQTQEQRKAEEREREKSRNRPIYIGKSETDEERAKRIYHGEYVGNDVSDGVKRKLERRGFFAGGHFYEHD